MNPSTVENILSSKIDERYVIVGEPLHGGMSTVQKAFDPVCDRYCAIKRMKGADSLKLNESFNREAAALDKIGTHPNIVALYDAGKDAAGFYMVLESIPQNLAEWMNERAALTWPDFFKTIGKPTLDALIFGQSRGWVHRDFKPSNILITESGVAKVADFGIAKQIEKPSLGLTLAQFKSAPYSPPEDDVAETRFSRDCFSWAAVAAFCITAKNPKDYGELEQLLANLDRDSTPAVILQSALSNDPNERPVTASALLAELEEYETTRSKAAKRSRLVYFSFEPNCLQQVMRVTGASSQNEVLSAFLEEMNEVGLGFQSIASTKDAAGLRVFAVTWTMEVVGNQSGRLTIVKAWLTSPADIERRREASFRPEIQASFGIPTNMSFALQEIDRLAIETESFEEEARSRMALAEKERVFRSWYAFLRAKADFEGKRENAISFVNSTRRETTTVLSTELPAPIEIIGQSRVIKSASGKPIVCEVVDVNLDEVIVRTTSGDPLLLPKSGKLEINTIAAEKSIERQRIALDAVNYDRAANPRLKQLIIDPSLARQSLPAPSFTIGGGAFDQEKMNILSRALGLDEVLVIQGPPGTGKTRLIEEIVVQYLRVNPRQRVLVSSQTHVALDNVLERILEREPSIDIVRVGKSEDPKISPICRDLVLDRKAQEWANGVRDRARAFISKWALQRGIDRDSIEMGMIAEKLILLLSQKHAIEKSVREAEALVKEGEEQSESKLSETGSSNSPDIETASVEAQNALGNARSAMTSLNVEIKEARERLRAIGGYGTDLAQQTDESELREWVSLLLGNSEYERQCRILLELQEDWILRAGKSSDFHAAMLSSAQIVAGTCIGMAGVRGMTQVAYDLCIVDEASKATATEILVPLSRSRKWILVGDPLQLPPFFEENSLDELGDFLDDEVRRTLLDRFQEGLPEHSKARLKRQHRMVKPIGDMISQAFYDGLLESPKTKPDVTLTGSFPKPITWLSTSELVNRNETRRGASFQNDAECRAIRDALGQINFIAQKRRARYEIAVIAGYMAQVNAIQDSIRDRLHEWTSLQIKCSTVDSFQGSEVEVCIYSVTRSNVRGQLGFLREKPRLNVALSRGRSALIIVGDDIFCRTVSGENPFRKVLDFFEANSDTCERRCLTW